MIWRQSAERKVDAPILEDVSAGALPPVAPEEPVYAVGDLHGRVDLLTEMLERLDADMLSRGRDEAQVVFLGDYVDRGDHAAEVLEWMHWLSWEYAGRVVCLKGNHEAMMLDFLVDPEGRGPRWLRNGGLQTLASYGIGGLTERAPAGELLMAAERLRAALPEGLEDWLRGLPLTWGSGNLVCLHAAADPAQPIEAQDPATLLWGHRDFLSGVRSDGVWIAHGHTVVDEPEAVAGRIAVDTGACFTGRLTAAAVYPGEDVRFLST